MVKYYTLESLKDLKIKQFLDITFPFKTKEFFPKLSTLWNYCKLRIHYTNIVFLFVKLAKYFREDNIPVFNSKIAW